MTILKRKYCQNCQIAGNESKDYNSNMNIKDILIYEDNNLLVLNKPRGLLLQQDSSGSPSLDNHVPLVMVVTGYYDIKIQDIKYGLLAFGILGTTMWIFDAFTGCDYFYFYDGHTFPVLKIISENVHHLVWTLIVVSCYVITGVAMHFLIIGAKYLANKKRLSNDSPESLE